MTRSRFSIRRPVLRDTPEVRLVGWADTAGYSSAEFCAAAMSPRVTALFRHMVNRGRSWVDQPEEVQTDFILKMLETEWWRRWSPVRGNLESFVVRFATVYIVDRRCRGARTLRRRTKREREGHRRAMLAPVHNPARTLEAVETIERLARMTNPRAAEAMDAFVSAGGDERAAAERLGVSVRELKALFREVAADAKSSGIDPILRSRDPVLVPVIQ